LASYSENCQEKRDRKQIAFHFHIKKMILGIT
jgi:hypothetical protein